MDVVTKEFPELSDEVISADYERAKDAYLYYGVSPNTALEVLAKVRLSMHCWQGDDVGGFESAGALTGGIVATGKFPGKARDPDELRQDAEKAMSLVPGRHKFNLHAIYLENRGKPVDRDEIGYEHFKGWVDWAKHLGIGLDFNPTFFSHPKSDSGLTLSHPDPGIRNFWIRHAMKSRRIAEKIAQELDDVVVNNYWIPDSVKDSPVDRWGSRARLLDSYRNIFSAELDAKVKESVEGKLFGIGGEAYTAGSHEFYLLLAREFNKMLCLDMGHFHPTETIADKLSAVMTFLPEILVHVSRPMRWDSDHVVIRNDDLRELALEIVRGGVTDRVYLATDYFDASINRVGAWAIGQRSVYNELLCAMLEPTYQLKQLELDGRGAEKLALLEECKNLPHAAVWNYFCMKSNVPVGAAYINEIKAYQDNVLSKRMPSKEE